MGEIQLGSERELYKYITSNHYWYAVVTKASSKIFFLLLHYRIEFPHGSTLELYDRPSAPLELKIRMLRAEVLEIMLNGCVTWSPRASHYDTLRRAHHSSLTRCIGWQKNDRADHPISYLDSLICYWY